MGSNDWPSLLGAAQRGQGWAFEGIYRNLHPVLHAYLRAQAGGEADDLAAEVWLAVAERIGRFSGTAPSFRSWVFTIAHHRLVDHRRRASRRRTEVAAHEDLPDGVAGDVESDAFALLERTSALARIAGLPPDQAEVVLLRIVGDFSVNQVASIVDKEPGAVRALQHRAMQRMARQLAREAERAGAIA